jgi:hypothetical protein
MKDLWKWTGMLDQGECRFKGWSHEGHKAYKAWAMEIKKDCILFERRRSKR